MHGKKRRGEKKLHSAHVVRWRGRGTDGSTSTKGEKEKKRASPVKRGGKLLACEIELSTTFYQGGGGGSKRRVGGLT